MLRKHPALIAAGLVALAAASGCISRQSITTLTAVPENEIEQALLDGLRAQLFAKHKLSLFTVSPEFMSWTMSTQTGNFPISIRFDEVDDEFMESSSNCSLRTRAAFVYNDLGENGTRRQVTGRWTFEWKENHAKARRFAAAVAARARTAEAGSDRPRLHGYTCRYCGYHVGHFLQILCAINISDPAYTVLDAFVWRHRKVCHQNPERVTPEQLDQSHVHNGYESDQRCDSCFKSHWPCEKRFDFFPHPRPCPQCK